MKTVWTLRVGENHCSGRLVGMFAKRSEAVNAAEDQDEFGSPWLLGWSCEDDGETTRWTNGRAWMEVKRVLEDTEAVL